MDKFQAGNLQVSFAINVYCFLSLSNSELCYVSNWMKIYRVCMGLLNAKALQHSRSLLYGSQELLQKVTTSTNVSNIVSKIQEMMLIMP